MPTSYTDMIDEDPNLSTAKWVTKGLSRNFGVCVILRDHDMNLSEEEIEEYLKKEVERGTSYYREKLSETQETLRKLSNNPEETWIELYASTVGKINQSNTRSIDGAKIKKIRHQQVKEDLIKLRDVTKDEVTRNIANFGLSQLELVKSETEPYIQEIPSFEKFKEDKIKSLKRDIEYYTKNIEETEEREKERLLSYQTIRSEVSEILSINPNDVRRPE